MTSAPSLLTFELEQTLPGFFHMPTRMTAIATTKGVVLVSPIPIDDRIAHEIEGLGEVRYLVAPNLLHHLYLAAAKARYPWAKVVAPRGLQKKSRAVVVDATFEDGGADELSDEVVFVPFHGAPALAEQAIFHPRSASLVLTDLVFNVLRPRGIVAHVVFFLVGCYKRLAQSRALRALVRDERAARESAEKILALPFERIVVAHGDPVDADGRARLRAALGWLVDR